MKNFVKAVSLILTITLLLCTLAACGKNDKKSDGGTTTAPNTVTVTFPEGMTVIDIAERLEQNGVCSAADFLTVCNQPYDGIEIDNPDDRVFLLEGYVFPDTYEFYKNSSAKSALDKFIDNYNSKITPEMKQRAADLGFTVDEIITLASIIQKECDKDTAECANVSSVFHNRLQSPSFPKLQSDVTTFYIKNSLGEYLGYNSEKDFDEQNENIKKYMNLYSTYYCNGLPVGPICNPGIKAINAALNPADTDYYYFLTDKAGEKFYYSATIAEHRKNGKEAGIF